MIDGNLFDHIQSPVELVPSDIAPARLDVVGSPLVVVNHDEGHVDLVYTDGPTVRLADSVVRVLVATILATDPT